MQDSRSDQCEPKKNIPVFHLMLFTVTRVFFNQKKRKRARRFSASLTPGIATDKCEEESADSLSSLVLFEKEVAEYFCFDIFFFFLWVYSYKTCSL
jgi:hypothetical protein